MFLHLFAAAMAVASLRYNANLVTGQTKSGSFVYDGTPARVHEWEFRSGLRWNAIGEEDKETTRGAIIESLRGEAAFVAMDLSSATLMANDGFKDLVNAVRKHVFPQARAEAKELYRVGHRTKGVMARQPTEPMVSYVSRRRRWWRLLTSLDKAAHLSETIRGDLMLEASGLTETQQLMVLTSVNNDRDFDKVAGALLEQSPNAHLGVAKITNSGRRQAHLGHSDLHRGREQDEDDYDSDDEGDSDCRIKVKP